MALDLGCGTGDNSIYLAKHGWQVTGVDYVAKPLDKARAKAAANKVAVNFTQADVTRLSSEGVGANFGLIVDNGCLHGMSDEDRDAYVREVTAVAAPVLACCSSNSFPAVRSVSPASTRPRSNGGSPRTGRCCRLAMNPRWTTTGRTRRATTCFSAARRARQPRAG